MTEFSLLQYARFDFEGGITSFYDHEWHEGLSLEEKANYDYSPDFFEHHYIGFNNSFERGDIVTLNMGILDSTSHKDWLGIRLGVVETSQEEWHEFQERVKNGMYVDDSDCVITVEWLGKQGVFHHDHVEPIYLELYEPKKDEQSYKLIKLASDMLKGEVSLDFYQGLYEKYRGEYESVNSKEEV